MQDKPVLRNRKEDTQRRSVTQNRIHARTKKRTLSASSTYSLTSLLFCFYIYNVRSVYQPPLEFIDPIVKLSVAQRELAKIIRPVPDLKTIVAWCESGELTGTQLGPGRCWYIFTSSLDELILRLHARSQQKLAA